MKNRKILFGSFGLLIVIISCVLLLLHKHPKEAVFPVVTTEEAATQDIGIFRSYPGTIKAKQFVEIHARVEGYLESMLFEEGSHIRKNQVLFVIDPKHYKAKVDKAKALLDKSSAQAKNMERQMNRIKPLYEQNAASQLDYDNAVAAYESAKADVAVCQADLVQDQLALSYTTVRSPISGYISERLVDIGSLVGPGKNSLLAVVVSSDTVFVEFKMTDLDYQICKSRNVNLGQSDTTRKWNPYVKVTLADKKEYGFSGTVDFADPKVDSRTGTFTVRAALPNPAHELLPGQFTNVTLLMDVRENAVVVPRKSIIIERSSSYVYVMRDDGTVEKRFVELGPEQDNYVVIERGIWAGEDVVTEGQNKLSNGIKAITSSNKTE